MKADPQDQFVKAVTELQEVLSNDMQHRKQEASDYAAAHEAEMKAGLMRSSGFSESDVLRMQDGRELTAAEKKEMADRMVRQKTNMSIEEAQKLGSMSEANRQAWAQGYTAEQMAAAQARGGQNPGADNTAKRMYELSSEQSALATRLSQQKNDLLQRYTLMDQEAQAAKTALELELKPLYDELNTINDGEGSTQADADHANRVVAKIHARQDQFCSQYTPRINGFIEICRTGTLLSVPDYDRLEQIQAELTAIQTGTAVSTAGKGLLSLQAVDEFLGYLSEAFRYKLYSVE
jgi:hypothetical protein